MGHAQVYLSLPTFWQVAKLATNYISVISVPAIITNSAPGIAETHFHPSLVLEWSINQSDISILAWSLGHVRFFCVNYPS